MSANAPNNETAAQAAGAAALSTAEQMLPLLIAGVSAGMKASTPQGAMLELAAEVIPPLIQSYGANSGQIKQLLQALVPQLDANQASYDATAAARGITDPTQAAPTTEPAPAPAAA